MSASMALSKHRVPVVVILGATGSGKSKLALEIGKKFKSEIISADSMQIYKGLDIVTNKVTKEELQQCPHHMIDYVSPLQEKHTVVEYRDKAVPIIDSLLERKILPIIVGGTNYYIEALLYNFLISKKDVEKAQCQTAATSKFPKAELPNRVRNVIQEKPEESKTKNETSLNLLDLEQINTNKLTENSAHSVETRPVIKRQERSHKTGMMCPLGGEIIETVRNDEIRVSYEHMDNEALLKRLQEVDPETAERVTTGNRRKLIRALEVYDIEGIPMSQIFKAQKISKDAERGPLRYKDLCVFWVQSEKDVLCKRIDKRVDEMIERGLIQELLEFHRQYNASRIRENREIDYTHGIFQSIGFKEFHEYLIMSEEDRQRERGENLLAEGIEKMKLVTRRYARYQVKLIASKFLKRKNTEVPPVYALDSTDVSKWRENVHDPAISILTDVIEGRKPRYDPLPPESSNTTFVVNFCEVCEKRFVTEQEWQSHLRSRMHENKKRKNRVLKERALRETCRILDAEAISKAKTQDDPTRNGDNVKPETPVTGSCEGLQSVFWTDEDCDTGVSPVMNLVQSESDDRTNSDDSVSELQSQGDMCKMKI